MGAFGSRLMYGASLGYDISLQRLNAQFGYATRHSSTLVHGCSDTGQVLGLVFRLSPLPLAHIFYTLQAGFSDRVQPPCGPHGAAPGDQVLATPLSLSIVLFTRTPLTAWLAMVCKYVIAVPPCLRV